MQYIAIPLLGILGLWLGFPNPLFQLPLLVLLFPVVLYNCALQATTAKQAFRMGWLIGMVAYTACLYWIAIPVHEVGYLPWVLAVPCSVVIAAGVGFYSGLFCLAIRLMRDKLTPLQRALFAGLIWYLLEWARGFILTGFPWLTLSSAFVPWTITIQGASLIGAYALSGFFVSTALYAYEGLRNFQQNKRSIGIACACVVCILSFGYYAITRSQHIDTSDIFQGAFIQGNIDQNQKWEPVYQESTIHRYLTLTKYALKMLKKEDSQKAMQNLSGERSSASLFDTKNSPQIPLIIWPETAMPFLFQDHKTYTPALRNAARNDNVAILVGTLGYTRTNNTSQGFTLYNRAYLLSPTGYDVGYYDKEHLVPFGEYLPKWLNIPLLEPLLQGAGNMTSGTTTQPILWQNLALGMLICYESIFPELARQRVEDGANVFINISNDAWFGRTSAPEQHLQLSAMRAVEQHRFLLRGTNTGISAVVDPNGRIITQSTLFRAEAVPFTAYSSIEKTPFYYLMPWLPWIAIALCIVLIQRRPHGKL